MDIQLICDETKQIDQQVFEYDREENPGYYHYVRTKYTHTHTDIPRVRNIICVGENILLLV